MNEERERWYDLLLDATGENAKSKALDEAARFYVKMAGGTNAREIGHIERVLREADEQGSLTAAEIAETLDTRHCPVDYTSTINVGTDDD